ncbi:hypothetical protein VOWphi5012_072 [Vibrio phage phi50-12]|uniref:Uncharacterized protein n=1 Tax=Vibrio phage phi50-12 TaxID=2654972 RepID=A0A5P8PRG5_9CAUD|nr:hypothetical protein KNU82_gp072 [Vibrio phage phi50-12]QFR59856.1 hypothetical protein VOWphi5012_072 [Vibrio phage phi50-12]
MRYFKAIVKLKSKSKDVQAFIKINDLEITKPITLIVEKYQEGDHYINKAENTNFKWPDNVTALALNHAYDEFEIILKGKELDTIELGELLHGKVLPSNN